MRRLAALGAAIMLVASVAGSSVAAPPTSQVNHVVGDFDFLTMDGAPAGHVVVDYREPTGKRWVPGTLDVTWVEGAPFPYNQPPYGVKVSHTILTWAGFGLSTGEPAVIVQSGAGGSMCDFGAEWNATCHDFQIIIKEFNDGTPTLIAFGQGDWGAGPSEWYKVGGGDFQITYVGPTGS